jgi:hypothetical protein
MDYKEFYIWLDGFMTNRCWTTIKQIDIQSIQDKMKEVKDDLPKLGGNKISNEFIPNAAPTNPLRDMIWDIHKK